tara:strand:- start:333 stop:704 length:372 start_codon:yes stop_codon:yes gene_type:complete
MGTLTTKLTLTSSNILTDAFNLSVTDTASVLGKVVQKTVVTSGTAAVFLTAAGYTDSYIFLKNKSSTAAEIIHIRSDGLAHADIMSLGAGEFAFFPWSSDEDLVYDAASGTPVLEVIIFQAVA